MFPRQTLTKVEPNKDLVILVQIHGKVEPNKRLGFLGQYVIKMKPN